ncbi:uncharacterized protein LOC108913843 [Anoplophora glabripennis]|uniref:uncharacterized protein LOC108913843 n=1 Tax=Anoplophora glabripennis TaxID=217634 RepID=UPI0008756227|nr:uncharacterized protein LOC108913843 [Anoplophora glabripennis]
MNQLECIVQKHVEMFCKIMPRHVEKWKILLQHATKPAEALSNYAEQLRHVQKAAVTHIEEFAEIQKNIEYKIVKGIDYEIRILKEIVDQLNSLNHEMRNKLSLLERSTIDLNWDNDSQLLVGTALQPPLWKILHEGLCFWSYFADAMKCINNQMKYINVKDVKSMEAFENCFNLNLDNSVITNLLSKTQYVNNEKLLV